jgi:hypothetical protein
MRVTAGVGFATFKSCLLDQKAGNETSTRGMT